MPRYKIALANGHTQEVEGRRFSYHLENIQHWFVVHRDHRTGIFWTLTEKSTGLRVQDIPHSTLAACQGDAVAAAKQVLKHLSATLGEARIREAIRQASAAPAVEAQPAPNQTARGEQC